MDKPIPDSVLMVDQRSRRRFIRTGAAFLLAGGSVAKERPAYADECDRAPDENNPKRPGPGSDSDSGSNADPAGCGRREPPKISLLKHRKTSDKNLVVARVTA